MTSQERNRGATAEEPAAGFSPLVVWHDVECGRYAADLPLWRALAEREGGPVLDVGAGTGRVTLHLAGLGYPVVAFDTEEVLLRALEHRAEGLPVETAVGDARTMQLGRRFGLIIAPMQTIQLLDGPEGRAAFLRAARDHLLPGGVLACAIAHPLEGFDSSEVEPPAPDFGESGEVWLVSRPVAIRDEGDRVALVREREAVETDGTRTVEHDVIHLDRLPPKTLEDEGAAAGLQRARPLLIPATDDYIASTVVMLHA
jgi:SAM-dependent methyltransferase